MDRSRCLTKAREPPLVSYQNTTPHLCYEQLAQSYEVALSSLVSSEGWIYLCEKILLGLIF